SNAIRQPISGRSHFELWAQVGSAVSSSPDSAVAWRAPDVAWAGAASVRARPRAHTSAPRRASTRPRLVVITYSVLLVPGIGLTLCPGLFAALGGLPLGVPRRSDLQGVLRLFDRVVGAHPILPVGFIPSFHLAGGDVEIIPLAGVGGTVGHR